jgi:hypothetical protein
MAAFIYRCPNTGLRIQALAAAEITEDEDKYEPVTCVMCRQVHLVNPWTGKVLGDDDDRPHAIAKLRKGPPSWENSGFRGQPRPSKKG